MKFPGMVELSFRALNLDEARKVLSPFATLKSVHPYWASLAAAAKFAESPRKDVLAGALRQLADKIRHQKTNRPYFPMVFQWPFAACFEAADGPNDLRLFAERIDRGEMGAYEDWLKAEKRWQNRGITSDDVRWMEDERWPIPKEIADVGIPFSVCSIDVSLDSWNAVSIKDFWELLPGAKSRGSLSWLFIYYLLGESRTIAKNNALNTPDIREVIREAIAVSSRKTHMPDSTIAGVIALWGKSPDSVALLDILGKRFESIYYSEPGHRSRGAVDEAVEFIASETAKNPSLVGLRSLWP